MAPQVIPVDPRRPESAAVRAAAQALAAGRLVIVPTETVYGLCADPRKPAALEAVFAAKGRPDGKPLACLVGGLGHLVVTGAAIDPNVRALAESFWPGPLTLVLDTPAGVAGFRWPDHAVALEVVHALGRPVAATSANRSGEAPARTAAEAVAALGGSVDIVLDGGPVPGGVPSTVVRVHEGRVEILREGAIPAARIRAVLPRR